VSRLRDLLALPPVADAPPPAPASAARPAPDSGGTP
jgi:hypothetical protein